MRIIVGFAPGQAIDIVTRIIGQWLSEQLGQQFIIENRPGAGGNIATEAVVRAPPDGYTLLAIGSNKRSAGAVNALSTRDPHDLMKESRTVGHDGRATLLPFEAVTFARQADQPTRAPNQADRTPCYHRFESNRSARNPDSGPVRQPPKQRRAATVMEGANAIIDPACSSGPRAGHGARGGVGSGAIARGRQIRAGPTRTAKERLGGKASDEQRVDNCKVPPDLRGPKPRPEQCDDGTGKKR